jgi:hypothetical protein
MRSVRVLQIRHQRWCRWWTVRKIEVVVDGLPQFTDRTRLSRLSKRLFAPEQKTVLHCRVIYRAQFFMVGKRQIYSTSSKWKLRSHCAAI